MKVLTDEEAVRKLNPRDLRKLRQRDPGAGEVPKTIAPDPQAVMIHALAAIVKSIQEQGRFNSELVGKLEQVVRGIKTTEKDLSDLPGKLIIKQIPVPERAGKKWKFTPKRFEQGPNAGKIEYLEAEVVEE